MKRLVIPERLVSYCHLVRDERPILYAGSDVTPDSPQIERCDTRLGEPICSCGTFILEWDYGRRYGVSQATDGANA